MSLPFAGFSLKMPQVYIQEDAIRCFSRQVLLQISLTSIGKLSRDLADILPSMPPRDGALALLLVATDELLDRRLKPLQELQPVRLAATFALAFTGRGRARRK